MKDSPFVTGNKNRKVKLKKGGLKHKRTER